MSILFFSKKSASGLQGYLFLWGKTSFFRAENLSVNTKTLSRLFAPPEVTYLYQNTIDKLLILYLSNQIYRVRHKSLNDF